MAVQEVTGVAAGTRSALPWLVALLVLIAFAFQGTRGIWEPDEGRYSAAGINMHESGNWLIPTVDGEHPHLTKPPITYWALAASFALLGHNEWAARLPSALAFVGSGLLVFGLGRRLCPSKAWLPAVVWALSFGPAIASNIVSTDAILVFFETAAMFAFVEAWSRERAAARRWFVLMWVAWGLAFMTKGPPGLLPLLGMTLFLGIHDRRRLRELFVLSGFASFLLVAFTWFAVVIAQQPDRLEYFLGYEVYDRVFTATHDRNAQWYGGFEVYVPVLAFGTLPWSVLAIVAAGGLRPAGRALRDGLRQRRPEWLLLAYWLLVPLTAFFAARSRLQLYVLPLFVPIALMLARAIVRSPAFTERRLAWIAGLTAAALVALKATVAYWPMDRDARELSVQLEHIFDPHDLEEIVFVGMPPFYGLTLYMDRHIEGIEIGENRFHHSKFVDHEDLCEELAERERSVYGIKPRRAPAFVVAAARCGAEPRLLGKARADGSDILFYALSTEANPANSR
jgi:4-amino-4-deoxy-L-arabinose transferase-like glycosyltransferase